MLAERVVAETAAEWWVKLMARGKPSMATRAHASTSKGMATSREDARGPAKMMPARVAPRTVVRVVTT